MKYETNNINSVKYFCIVHQWVTQWPDGLMLSLGKRQTIRPDKLLCLILCDII